MSETVSWDEEVTFADGRLLLVHRKATYGPDEWGRSGRGVLKEQSIRFSYDGQKVKWENDEKWPITYMPDILDVVANIPVLVVPVHRWGPCNKYDFPQEGLVAFAYQNGDWRRISLAELPANLKVNLLRSTHALRYWKEYEGKLITPSDKLKLETGGGWGATKPGQSILEASKFYSAYEESCARIRPLPDQQLEEARQRNIDAERSAPTVQADLVSVTSDPEAITGKDFTEQKGIWTGVGYLTKGCKGIVEKIEPIREWSGDDRGYRSRLVGYQLIIANSPKRKVQIPETSRAQMQCVVCDQTTIYAVRRQDKERLILHRFRHNGDLIDAFRVSLPETTKITASSEWGTLWSVVPGAEGGLAISIADYTYPQLANLGGTINRKVNYALQPPSLPR